MPIVESLADDFELSKNNISGRIAAAAEAMLHAGLSVLPARLKEKRPAVDRWETYQQRLPTLDEIRAWFAHQQSALCVVCGRVSGNLEVIDFSFDSDLYYSWMNIVREEKRDLFDRLLIEYAASGDKHVAYRCQNPVPDGQKLVQGKTGRKDTILIQTLGEGDFSLCFPSFGYVLLQGSYADLPVLSPEERNYLLSVARTLNGR